MHPEGCIINGGSVKRAGIDGNRVERVSKEENQDLSERITGKKR